MAPGEYDWWERKPCMDSMRCTGSPASSALALCASPKCGMRPDGPLRGMVRRDWPPSACTRRCAPSADATHARLSYAGVWAGGARSRMTARNAWSEGETTHRFWSFNQERFLDCVPWYGRNDRIICPCVPSDSRVGWRRARTLSTSCLLAVLVPLADNKAADDRRLWDLMSSRFHVGRSGVQLQPRPWRSPTAATTSRPKPQPPSGFQSPETLARLLQLRPLTLREELRNFSGSRAHCVGPCCDVALGRNRTCAFRDLLFSPPNSFYFLSDDGVDHSTEHATFLHNRFADGGSTGPTRRSRFVPMPAPLSAAAGITRVIESPLYSIADFRSRRFAVRVDVISMLTMKLPTRGR